MKFHLVRMLGGSVVLGVVGFIAACSSQPEVQQVEPKSQTASSVLDEVKEDPTTPAVPQIPENPVLVRLTQKLQTLGYDAIGLQFETEETLRFLETIFDSPSSQNRQVRIVYTGLALSYDPKHQSLTIGGTQDLKMILKFIEKNIPKRNSKDFPVSSP